MKKFKILLSGICLAILFSSTLISCSEDVMDEINRDKNHAEDVQSQFIVTDLLTSTAFTTVGGDLSYYASIYIEHEGGFWGQFYNAETRGAEPTGSSTYNNMWGGTYGNVLYAKTAIDKCSEGGAEADKKATLGVAQIMLAYNAAILTDLFGDTPFSEAGEKGPDGKMIMQPKIDKQQDIYAEVMALLDAAITNLTGASNTLGKQDLIYAGAPAPWIKVAYGLKARYTMRLLGKSANQTQDLNNVLDYISKSFDSAAAEFKFNVYDGSSANNPYYRLWWDRDNYGASASFMEKLLERNDPRAKEIYLDDNEWVQITDPAEVVLVPNGKSTQIQGVYSVSTVSAAQTAPTHLLSYHELLFLKAEALCRLNRASEAEPVLKAAIAAAFKNTGNSIVLATKAPTPAVYGGISAETTLENPQVAEDYYNNSIKALFSANPLKETMIQKYLAMQGANGESLEAYSDYRRLQGMNEVYVALKNPLNDKQFPLRYTYGSSDVQANKAVADAYGDGQYVYSEKVWWAGGSR